MTGRTLGHYRIAEKLGAGGMGVVYRAADTRLGRDVAIKLLPDAFAADPARVARFQQEARHLAALNHPNIAAIHGFEDVATEGADRARFLVLELVPGETLAQKVGRAPLAVPEALTLCRQIAEALEAAHESGVIHRDLKPANVKVTPDGKVKVLDFGLAKAFAPQVFGSDAPGSDLSQSPTLTYSPTQVGTILGTASYMSPEQARGKPIDKRTDIWSFGCVLYEVLTGKLTFQGETVSDTIAKILEREPAWEKLPAAAPPGVETLLRRCLQKDPRQRLRDIGDARIEIDRILSRSTTGEGVQAVDGVSAGEPGGRLSISWGLLAAIVLGSAVVAGVLVRLLTSSSHPAPRRVSHLAITLPPEAPLAANVRMPVAVSPDGARIVYVTRQGDDQRLILRSLDSQVTDPVPGTEGAEDPFFSPDGSWVGFFAGGKLLKISLSGGPPVTICEAHSSRGASWGPDGTIYFTTFPGPGLMQVPASGGVPKVAAAPSEQQFNFRWPDALPSGEVVLFNDRFMGRMGGARLAAYFVERKETAVLLENGLSPKYAASGHVVFGRDGTLFATPFDPGSTAPLKEPVPVLEGVRTEPITGATQFGVSSDGTLVYVPGQQALDRNSLVWADRRGRTRPLLEPRVSFMGPRLSPGGNKLALTHWKGTEDLWVHDFARGTMTRLTFGGRNFSPAWSPDGKRLVFGALTQSGWGIYALPSDGSKGAEELMKAQTFLTPTSWSADGKLLAFNLTNSTTGVDIWILPMEGERKPFPFLQTPFWEGSGRFSPDGRWMAYQSDESGRPEIYIQPFPGPGAKVQISSEGGTSPEWGPGGRELFFANGRKVMAVSVSTGAIVQASKPTLLFEAGEGSEAKDLISYHVAPDGQRFVLLLEEVAAGSAEVRVVLNWFEELNQRVPTGKN